MAKNTKKVLISGTMAGAGWDLLKSRPDVAATPFPHTISADDFRTLLKASGEVNGMILGLTRVGEPELEVARGLQVVARIGVGYDTVDVAALTRHRIPLMVTGIANSPSVAEQAVFFMLALAKKGAALDGMVRQAKWSDRLSALPGDVFEKCVLVIGFGRIGSRTVKRCLAMDMRVLVFDPYVDAAKISAAGAEPVSSLDDALPQADFVSIHCPKTPETVGMFGSSRLKLMKPTAYLVNTARGGIIDEPALHDALTNGVIAGAGLDVFEEEPPAADHPLLKLDTIITAPHMAGVTREAFERMAMQAVRNVLSVFDGKPIAENVINREVLG